MNDIELSDLEISILQWMRKKELFSAIDVISEYMSRGYAKEDIRRILLRFETNKWTVNESYNHKKLTDIGFDLLKSIQRIEIDKMEEGDKIHKLLKYVVETDMERFSWSARELVSAFDETLTEYEVQCLLQKLIDNGDGVDCSSKDGFNIGINEKSKASFYSKKYIKSTNQNYINPQPIIQIGTIQQVVESTIHGGMIQSSGASSSKKIERKTIRQESSMVKKIIISVIGGLILALILYYIFGINP
ncbi:MAG: hypothetical protein KF687_04430 [Cyclobacteriaceae bacterium]|nr:hypothetical protein [Cyclobacteriaceae bacterium]